MPFLFVPQKTTGSAGTGNPQIITREPTDIGIEPLGLDRFEGGTLHNLG
jgi:hypothetical protein